MKNTLALLVAFLLATPIFASNPPKSMDNSSLFTASADASRTLSNTDE